MHVIPCGFAALVVASLFYTWRAYQEGLLRRERTLRQRIAYMLWVIAERIN